MTELSPQNPVRFETLFSEKKLLAEVRDLLNQFDKEEVQLDGNTEEEGLSRQQALTQLVAEHLRKVKNMMTTKEEIANFDIPALLLNIEEMANEQGLSVMASLNIELESLLPDFAHVAFDQDGKIQMSGFEGRMSGPSVTHPDIFKDEVEAPKVVRFYRKLEAYAEIVKFSDLSEKQAVEQAQENLIASAVEILEPYYQDLVQKSNTRLIELSTEIEKMTPPTIQQEDQLRKLKSELSSLRSLRFTAPKTTAAFYVTDNLRHLNSSFSDEIKKRLNARLQETGATSKIVSSPV